jgi:hypothetical protein
MSKKIEILTVEGYFNRFYTLLQGKCRTHLEAFHELEKELENNGFPRRYLDINSFKNAKRYHLVLKKRISK